MKAILKHLAGVALLAVALFLAPTFFVGIAGQHAGAAYAGATTTVANASGPTETGVALGGSTTPQGGFGNAVTQPTDPSQAQASYALGQSAVVVYLSAQTPAAVNAGQTTEQDFTVTGVAAGSVVAISKSTTQAGLGIVGCRVKAANTVSVVFCNPTAGNLTPTGGENYWIVEFRGPLIQSAVLAAPTIVGAHTTNEQIFTLAATSPNTGISAARVANEPGGGFNVPAGSTVPTTATSSVQLSPSGALTPSLGTSPQCVVLNKPTAQAGLGYFCRVVDHNQLGITYTNTTAAGITPTAGETYKFIALRGLALTGTVTYGVNVGVLAAVNNATAAEQTVACVGLAVGDQIVAVGKPADQAGIAVAQSRLVTVADTLPLKFVNPTAGNLTPTASEVYQVKVDKSLTGKGGVLTQFQGTLSAPVAVGAITGAEQLFTMTGAVSGAPVVGLMVATGAGWSASLGGQLPPGLVVGGVRASATDTVAVNFLNFTGVAIIPPALQAICLQAPIDSAGAAAGAAGSFVAYPIDVHEVHVVETLNALQRALVKLGWAAGA